MGLGEDLEIENTLRDALRFVLGALPTSVEPVEVLSAYVFSLVKDLGLSESKSVDPADHERPKLPEPLRPFISKYLPLENDDQLRNLLYSVFVALADSPGVGKTLNRNRPLGQRHVLLLAQTAWNIERNDARPKLPLEQTLSADIPDPSTGKDFARMMWTERSNLKGVPGRSSGDSYRKQVARLAVLVATHLISGGPDSAADLKLVELEISDSGRRTIFWRKSTDGSMDACHAAILRAGHAPAGEQVLVGGFAEVGGWYEPRGFDAEIERFWTDGGNRRIWLRGGPGLGKSYTARRVMQDSLARRVDSKDELLIWVDSADRVSVTRELARAAKRMPELGATVSQDASNRDDHLARLLLKSLRTTEIRWLIVFDDARADELIQQQLLPPGTNPNGRVLITTLGAPDADSAGRQVIAEQFTAGEAEHFLYTQLPNSSTPDRLALATKVDHHPLVLAMAAATIAAERMTVNEWLADFDTKQLDVAADYPDAGGYPHPISATWRVALEKAARGMADGVVERAAMVAAIQDPTGHPTWLWFEDAVREWVGAEAQQSGRNGRIHPAVRRLVDFGILQLLGNWSNGRVVIHRMAARAVRESAAPAVLAELAAILAKEWTLQLTANPALAQREDVCAAIRPLDSVPGLDSFTEITVAALLAFSGPAAKAKFVRWSREELDELEPLLLRGGVIGRADLAERQAGLGREERAQGRHAEARARFAMAYDIYGQLAGDASLDEDLRAEVQESMAELDATLGRSERAQELRLSAVRLRERLAETVAPDEELSLSNLIALADLHRGLADDVRSVEALDRARSEQAGRSIAKTDDSASMHAQLARRLAVHGRMQEAIGHMREAARLCEDSEWGRVVELPSIRRELGMFYAQQGRWNKAERWLRRGDAEPLLIASVQLHRGHDDAARASIAAAAAGYSAAASSDSEGGPLPDSVRDLRRGVLGIHFTSLAQKAAKRARWADASDIAAVNLAIARARADSTPGDDPAALADAYTTAGVYASFAGRFEAATEFLTSGLSVTELLVQLHPEDDAPWVSLATSLTYLADVHRRRGAVEDAIDPANRAVSILQRLDTVEPREDLDVSLGVLAAAYAEVGATEQAVAIYTQRVHTVRTRVDLAGRDGEALTALADALGDLVWVCVSSKRWGDALQPAIELVDTRKAIADEVPDSIEHQDQLARALLALGFIYSGLDRLVESEVSTREAVTLRARVLEQGPSITARQAEMAYALAAHAQTLSQLHRGAEAEAALTAAVNHLQLPAELDPAVHAAHQIEFLRSLSDALRQHGRGPDADAVTARVEDLERRFPNAAGD